MAALPQTAPRRAISPYARRLARERGIPVDQLRGSGPAGRIVAADVTGFVAPAATAAMTAAAFGTTIALATLTDLLARFAEAETPFTLDDIVLRAIGCALDDVVAIDAPDGRPVALELGRRQAVFADIRAGSLAPLRQRRLAALANEGDDASLPAVLSLRLLAASDIRPMLMPLLPGRPLRLVIAAGHGSAEALLSFDPARIDEQHATDLLSRFKAYLEVPLRLLA